MSESKWVVIERPPDNVKYPELLCDGELIASFSNLDNARRICACMNALPGLVKAGNDLADFITDRVGAYPELERWFAARNAAPLTKDEAYDALRSDLAAEAALGTAAQSQENKA